MGGGQACCHAVKRNSLYALHQSITVAGLHDFQEETLGQCLDEVIFSLVVIYLFKQRRTWLSLRERRILS